MNDLRELSARLEHVYWEVSNLNRHILHGAGVETRAANVGGLTIVDARLTERVEIANRRKVADIISEYRSILNGLAFSLVARGPSPTMPEHSPDFPAYKEKYARYSKRFFAHISAEDAALVPRCEGIDNIIVQLAERENQRKHRRLNVVTTVQTGVNFGGLVTIGKPASAQLIVGREWIPVLSGHNLDKDVQPRVTLRFPDPFGPHDVSVTGWLEFVKMSVEGIARRFGAGRL